ncbi:YitT family protein [Hephaestia sp. GCM10023244]
MIRRLIQLYAGLFAFGMSSAMMVRSDFGLNPWDVFHQGVGDRTPLSFGTVVIVAGAIVLLLWIPLRQRPGLGTVSNIIGIGLAADFGLWLIPEIGSPLIRAAILAIGIFLNGVATSTYIGAGFGPGPRDGLMTGLAARTGWSIRAVRTGIELTVLAVGWGLGGTVGIGTVLFAVTIGPIVHLTLPYFTIRSGGAPLTRAMPTDKAARDNSPT